MRSLKSASSSRDRRSEGNGRPRSRGWLLAGYLLVILSITLAPVPSDAIERVALPGVDKAVHALLFGGLALLLYWRPVAPQHLSGAIASFLQVAVLAGLIEALQRPLPYRSGDFHDFFAGIAGAIVAIAASELLVSKRRRGGETPGPGAGPP